MTEQPETVGGLEASLLAARGRDAALCRRAAYALAALVKISRDFQWMARRYADGRSTYAPGLVNDHTRELVAMGVGLNPTADGTVWARDGDGFGDPDAEHFEPGHPVARGDLLGLPPHVRLDDALLAELGLPPGAGAYAAVEAVRKLKAAAGRPGGDDGDD